MRTFCQILTPDIIKLLEKTEEKIAEIKNGGITSIGISAITLVKVLLLTAHIKKIQNLFIHFCQTDH